MLIETNIEEQNEPGVVKRWFNDKEFDLILWQSTSDERIARFHLSYGKPSYERILAWSEESGYRHGGVDDGEPGHGIKRSPLIVSDGTLNSAAVAQRFQEAAVSVDPAIVRFISEKITAFRE